jgi:hypothetical protein
MTKALVTCGKNPGVLVFVKLFAQDSFYGDASFIAQISADQQLLLPAVSLADYIHRLLNLCLDNHIEVVFAMSAAEQELLAEATELFSEFNIQLRLPDLITRKLLQNPKELFFNLEKQSVKTVSFQTTNSFAAFSKACLALGYPTESIAVASVQNLGLIWIVNDQLKTKTFAAMPVIPFTKAAKLFASDEELLLRQISPGKQNIVYASFIDGKLESLWDAENESMKDLIILVGAELKLNGLFGFYMQNNQLFDLKTFAVI